MSDIFSRPPAKSTILPTSFIRCHTFSQDGNLFAISDYEDNIKIFKTQDYSLLLTVQRMNVVSMTFVDGGSDILRILETSSTDRFVIDFKIHPTDGRTELLRGRWISSFSGNSWDYLGITVHDWSTFSDDGNTLMLTECVKTFTVYRFEADRIQQCILDDDVYMSEVSVGRMPVLSEDGCHCLSIYAGRASSTDDPWNPKINVWPELRFGNENMVQPIGIEGERAMWTGSGRYLAVWRKNQGTENAMIQVFKMTELKEDNVRPMRMMQLKPELFDRHVMGSRWPSSALFVFEEEAPGAGQLLEWDVEKESDANIVFTAKPTDASSNGPVEDDGLDVFWKMVMEIVHPLYSLNDNNRCIAAFDRRRQSFSIISSQTGVVVFNCTLEGMTKGKGPTTLAFDRSGRHLLLIGRESVLVYAPEFLRRCGSGA